MKNFINTNLLSLGWTSFGIGLAMIVPFLSRLPWWGYMIIAAVLLLKPLSSIIFGK